MTASFKVEPNTIANHGRAHVHGVIAAMARARRPLRHRVVGQSLATTHQHRRARRSKTNTRDVGTGSRSGPCGLAPAITLAQEGLEVTIAEAADSIEAGLRSSELTVPTKRSLGGHHAQQERPLARSDRRPSCKFHFHVQLDIRWTFHLSIGHQNLRSHKRLL